MQKSYSKKAFYQNLFINQITKPPSFLKNFALLDQLYLIFFSLIVINKINAVGIINRTGAWYQLEDGTKIQGREGFIDRVREDLDLQDMIKNKLSV